MSGATLAPAAAGGPDAPPWITIRGVWVAYERKSGICGVASVLNALQSRVTPNVLEKMKRRLRSSRLLELPELAQFVRDCDCGLTPVPVPANQGVNFENFSVQSPEHPTGLPIVAAIYVSNPNAATSHFESTIYLRGRGPRGGIPVAVRMNSAGKRTATKGLGMSVLAPESDAMVRTTRWLSDAAQRVQNAPHIEGPDGENALIEASGVLLVLGVPEDFHYCAEWETPEGAPPKLDMFEFKRFTFTHDGKDMAQVIPRKLKRRRRRAGAN